MILLNLVCASFASCSLNTATNVKYILNFEHKLEGKEKRETRHRQEDKNTFDLTKEARFVDVDWIYLAQKGSTRSSGIL
jgi:hypothetical protein